jgi:lipopolysaccharide/colanic/teichoic acid biosynthesis glycosyltransferase
MGLKRAFDLAIAIPGVVLTSPVMLATAFVMAATNRTSPLFVQQRVGQHGELFKIFKIKTLKDPVGPDQNLRDHAGRETPVGNFIRRTRLDELPQLFNIIKGDMSLVGPRPQLWHEPNSFHDDRIAAKPGLTGPAQIALLAHSHNTNSQSPDERLSLDLSYIKAAPSLGTDIRLMGKTLKLLSQKMMGKNHLQPLQMNG